MVPLQGQQPEIIWKRPMISSEETFAPRLGLLEASLLCEVHVILS